MKIRIIRNAMLLLEMQSVTILVDPFFMPWSIGMTWPPPVMTVDELPPCQLILCTHPHIDHFDLRPVLKRWPDVPVAVPQGVERRARRNGATSIVSPAMWEVYNHEACGATAVSVTPVPANHGGIVQGYILQTDGGKTLYLAGDTRYTEDMRIIAERFPSLDVALMPVEGLSFFGKMVAMDPQEAFDATQILRPQIVVPIHRDLRFNLPIGKYMGTIKAYVDKIREANLPTEVRILAAGEILHLED